MNVIVNQIQLNEVATIDNYERFLFTCPNNYAKITEISMREAYKKKRTDIIEGFLKITNSSGKSIYRRFRGYNNTSDTAYLGYRSMCELGIEDGDEVSVEPSCWFKYLIHNSDSYIKYSVIFAIVGVVCSVLSLLVAIVQLFIG